MCCLCAQVLHEKPALVAHGLACGGSVIHDDDDPVLRALPQATLRLVAQPSVVFEPGGAALVRAAIELAFAPLWTNAETIELEGVMSDADVAGLVKSAAALRVGHPTLHTM
jgi:hypothetical protein